MTGSQLCIRDPQHLEGLLYHGWINLSDDLYHNHAPGVSSTTLKRFLRSPAHGHPGLLTEDSDALKLGRALHLAVLQPDEFQTRAKIAPDVDRRTKEGKAAWQAFQEKLRPDDILITLDELATITGICSTLDTKATYDDLVAGAKLEIACFSELTVPPIVEDPFNDRPVLCKVKPDVYNPAGVVSDLKSCEDASRGAFFYQVKRYSYHVSAAYYLDVLRAAGQQADTFVWIAVEKKPPYGVAFYVCPEDLLELGRRQYRRALGLYSMCQREQKWPDYPDEILELTWKEEV